ncbi:MAG: ABC transporter ATP-binding protein [Pseudomonadota bacterium]
MASLRVAGLTVRAGETVLVSDANFELRPGQFVALLGPNGAGKSTLIRASMGLIAADRGEASIDGRATSSLGSSERARTLSYLPQQRSLAWPLPVRDVVALGRYCHGLRGTQPRCADREAIDRAMTATDLHSLASRRTDTLSGGELARVHCARALSTESPIMIADEPTAALDLPHAFLMMDVLKSFVDDGGAALVVLHDLPLAARYASHLLWMCDGRIVADGPIDTTLTEELCAEVYGIRATIDGRRLTIEGPL